MGHGNRPPKILITPARRHVVEAYCEYIIRYLSDEFYFEMGYPPYPPYDNIRSRVAGNDTSPLEKNPDEFDLIYPHFDTHWFLEPPEKYAHKVANVFFEPAGPRFKTAVVAGTSKVVTDGLRQTNPKAHDLRFGIDTELFKPYPMVRTDDLFHIGFVGNFLTPRRYLKDLFMPLKDIPGVRLMIFPTQWSKQIRPDELESVGGQDFIDSVVDGDKWWPGLPNLYNQMDLFIRCDIDHGYQFSVFEAAACGVPVLAVDSGPASELPEAVIIDNGGSSWQPDNLSRIAQDIRREVLALKDDHDRLADISRSNRKFIEDNWTWDRFIPAWREFFREGLKSAAL